MATSSPPEVYSHYWSSQAPVRLLFFFAVTGGAFGFAARGEDGGFGSNGGGGGGMTKQGWKEGLCNSVVFTWAFVEMLVWFWVKFSPFPSCLLLPMSVVTVR